MSTGAAVLAALPRLRAASSPGNNLRVAVMGLGRGMAHVNNYLAISGVDLAYVCDVDQKRMDSALASIAKKQKELPKGITDIRRALDDKSIDAISIAAPNFWHAPATIMACAAGKHVYVEKPGSHNPREGELMVAAARKHQRVVQLGTQRRSMPAVIEAMAKLREGVIGKLRYARCFYANARDTIKVGKVVPVPTTLDYALWQGPVPDRPYKDNLIPYNWHWMWHWGGGELANNGPHTLDLARWGLGVEYPLRASFGGGRFHFQDDQETPDSGTAVFDFGDCGASFENSSCHPRRSNKLPLVEFYGEGGSLAIEGPGYKVYDQKGVEIGKGTGTGSDAPHFINFVESIRGNAKPNAEIAEGVKSTLLCHLGNIAYRTGTTIQLDPKTHKIVKNAAAEKLWSREYRKGWEPKV